MHQTKKGKQWYFGAKAHIGVDSKETVVHSVVTSAASVADKHMLPDLLHGEERKVWSDGGYQGQTEAIRAAAPKAQDMTCRRTRYKNHVDEEAKRKNTTKARVKAKAEHPFRILKRVFGFTRVRYRGIWKKPPMAVRSLRAGEPVPTPQPAGPSKGVVSPEAGKRPPETKKTSSNPPFPTENRFKIKKSSEVASSLQNHAPAQRFLSSP